MSRPGHHTIAVRGAAAGADDPTPVRLVTLHVWRVPRHALPRALARMAVDPRRLRAIPGVRFGKLLGTGHGTGFGPTDADLTRWAALVAWADPARATGFDETSVGRAWRGIARSDVRLELRPLASRGRWSGIEPFGDLRTGTPADGTPAHPADGTLTDRTPTDGTPTDGTLTDRTPTDGTPIDRTPATGTAADRAVDGPVLALTRARLRARRAGTFWRAVPPVAAALRDAPGLLARFGIGEAPLGWQGTISVWRAATYLRDFAYRHPVHRTAISRTSTERWYAEELFARFEVHDLVGDPAVLDWVTSDGDREFRRWRVRSGQP